MTLVTAWRALFVWGLVVLISTLANVADAGRNKASKLNGASGRTLLAKGRDSTGAQDADEEKEARARALVAVFHAAQAERLQKGWQGHSGQYVGHKIINLRTLTSLQWAQLEVFAADEPGIQLQTDEQAFILVSANKTEETIQFLGNITVSFSVDDVASEIKAEYDENLLAFKADNPTDIVGRFPSVEELSAWLGLMASKYNHASLFDVGTSVEGRLIRGIAIKKHEGLPVIYLQSAMHAREWITLAANVWYINRLLTQDNGAEAWLTEQIEWRFVPLVNPDGYAWSYTKDRLWRKNRGTSTCSKPFDDLGPGQGIGVDLNRNWKTEGFSKDERSKRIMSKLFPVVRERLQSQERANSATDNQTKNVLDSLAQQRVRSVLNRMNDPCGESWYGEQAFDQPETRAVSKYLMVNKDQIQSFIDLHSYGQMWLSPPGLEMTSVPAKEKLEGIAKEARDLTEAAYGRSYAAGAIADTIPSMKARGGVAGLATDWVHDSNTGPGIKYAFTVEMRPDSSGDGVGFMALPSTIQMAAAEVWEGIKHVARHVSTNV